MGVHEISKIINIEISIVSELLENKIKILTTKILIHL